MTFSFLLNPFEYKFQSSVSLGEQILHLFLIG